MRNLKKALCLVMTIAMLMSMMIFTTSAANFTDNSEIANTEAVNTMNMLNIINGKGDGSYFDPTGIVTRAEMAKMICVALNGGTDPQLGTVSYSFTDTAGNWAAGYIEYCYNLGIVSGRGDGTFDPTGTVTGTEAAKMLLVAIGYDAAAEGFTGASWAIAVNVRANQKGFYTDLASMNPAAGLTRDNAAQMVYNAINATKVEYAYSLTTVNGSLQSVAVVKDVTTAPTTIVADKFKLTTEYGYMTGTTYSSVTGKYTYSLTAAASFGGPIVTSSPVTIATISSATDFSDLFGMKVKVMYKTSTTGNTLYGMYAKDSSVLLSGITGSLPTIAAADTSFKYSSISYKVDSGAINVYDFNTATTTALNSYKTTTTTPYSFKLVDNDGDSKADCAVAYPYTVGKVTFVGTTTATIANVSYTLADCDVYSGIAKNDFAMVTVAANTANGKVSIEKVGVISGECSALSSATKLAINGTYYNDASAIISKDTYALGSTFELAVVNGYVFNAKKVSSTVTSDDVLLVMAKDSVGTAGTTTAGTQKASVIFADGTKKVVSVDKVDTAAAGTLAAPVATTNEVAVDTMYTFAIDADGNYELSQMVAANYDAVKTSASANITVTSAKAAAGSVSTGTFYFADDAVVFVKAGTSYKALTGATVNDWGSTTYTTTGTTSALYANASNGFNTVSTGFLSLATVTSVPGAAGDTSYGWVTADPALVKVGTDYYIQTTIWTGTESVTYNAKSTATTTAVSSSTNVGADTDIAKGTPVSYKDTGDGYISTVTALTGADAVTAYADGGTEINFETLTSCYKLTDDTKYIYVDTANNTGVVGGAVSVATKTLLNTYVKNVYVVASSTDTTKVAVLIVDTANNIAANGGLTVTTGTLITAASTTANTCTVDGTTATATNFTGNIVAGVAASWGTGATADVVTSTTNSTAITTTDVSTGNVLRVVAADGTYYYFVITVI